MKNHFFIFVFALSASLNTSCQKTELLEWTTNEDGAVELRTSEDNAFSDDQNDIVNPDEVVKWKPNILPPSQPGVVKEVSDGDDESDNDESNSN